MEIISIQRKSEDPEAFSSHAAETTTQISRGGAAAHFPGAGWLPGVSRHITGRVSLLMTQRSLRNLT